MEVLNQKTAGQPLIDLQQEELLWASVSMKDVFTNYHRLDSGAYRLEGRHAREVLHACKWKLKRIIGANGIATAFYPERFKRTYVGQGDGKPFLLPSQITEIYPRPTKYVSEKTKCDLALLRPVQNDILLTRSGTVGTCAFVSEALRKFCISDDLIRIHCHEEGDAGLLYTFLKTKIGQALVKITEYGAVISHIEPEHLADIPVPYPERLLRKKIHDLISESFRLRDDSNDLVDKAHEILQGELRLPPLNEIRPRYFSDKYPGLRNFSVKLSDLDKRFDGSYHLPIADEISQHIRKNAFQVKYLGDSDISEAIILPGRFKRNYVQEGQGKVFFGGKQIGELDPSNKKYLSLRTHGERITSELELQENMTVITASGTIGKVNIVPKHWEKWTMNQHVLRVVPAKTDISGYIYAWLSSDYGIELIKRFTYGAVVDEVDGRQLSAVEIPILENKKAQQEINDRVLDANKRRYEAYQKEQEAIQIMNNEVIHT